MLLNKFKAANGHPGLRTFKNGLLSKVFIQYMCFSHSCCFALYNQVLGLPSSTHVLSYNAFLIILMCLLLGIVLFGIKSYLYPKILELNGEIGK